MGHRRPEAVGPDASRRADGAVPGGAGRARPPAATYYHCSSGVGWAGAGRSTRRQRTVTAPSTGGGSSLAVNAAATGRPRPVNGRFLGWVRVATPDSSPARCAMQLPVTVVVEPPTRAELARLL